MRITAYDGDQAQRRAVGGTVVGPTPVVAAAIVTVADAGTYFSGTDAEAVLAELGSGALRSISPTQLAADTNNWNPTGLSTAQLIRASTDASRNLTGLTAPTIEKVVILANVGSFALVLVNESASSTAANRFACSGATDVTLAAGGVAILVYDLTTDRWRVVSGGGGGGSSTLDGLTDVDTTGVQSRDVIRYDSDTASWVRDSVLAASGFVGCRAYNDATQAIATATDTALTWNQEESDTDGIHSTVTNPSRFTIPAGQSGRWRCAFMVTLPAGAGSYQWQGYIAVNGVAKRPTVRMMADTSGSVTLAVDQTHDLVAGDYVELFIRQSSGSTLNCGSATASAYNYAEVYRLGAGANSALVAVQASASGTQNVTNATYTAIPLAAESLDTDGFHSTSVNTSRLTVPAGMAGRYLITGTVDWDTNTSGERIVGYGLNGSVSKLVARQSAAALLVQSFAIPVTLAAGDYIELYVYQTSGGTRTVNADNRLLLSLTRLSGATYQAFVGARVYKSADQLNITSFTKVTYDTTSFDTNSFFDNANDRLTIPANLAGKYLITCVASMYNVSGASTDVQGIIYKNGAAIRYFSRSNIATNEWPIANGVCVLDLAAGDYIEVFVSPGSLAGSVDVRGGEVFNALEITRLGA